MRIGRLLLVTLCLALATVELAYAHHSVSQYPNFGWKYTILNRRFYQAPTDWPNTYNGRAGDAMQRWTGLTGSNLSFDLMPDAASDNWSCGTTWDHLTTANLSGVYAFADTCSVTNSTARIRINTDYDWYVGSSTPNPSSKPDLQAILTHEFGHAHQAWLQCTDQGDQDPCEGNHFDISNNSLICNGAIETDYHTMCWPELGGSEIWRKRSLEEHDKDLVEDMY